MGKGTNTTHINEGLYTIDYQYDTDAITARIATLTARLAELNAEQATITSDIETRESDITSVKDTIDQNIDDLNDLKSELSDLNSDLDEANTRLDEIPDEITEQEDLLAPIEARMLVIAVFLSPIQASIASKQAELAEATDPAVIAQLTSEIEALQEQETILSDEYDDLNEQKIPITTAISDLETEQSELEGTIAEFESDIPSKETEIATLQDIKHSNENDLSDYRADLLELAADLAAIELQIASTRKSIDALASIPTSVPGTYAWCADRTEDLSGEVGIMEVAGFEDSGINIQPGYEGNAVYDEERDGIMVPVEATSGAQSFWNKAMQGGWQKWRPTFRWGTITVIDYELDTCSVTMSAETNPDTGLDVNKMATLTGVPIEYMSCDSAPFAVGDTVVVKFNGQSWDDPVVIGFTSEPKGCGVFAYLKLGDNVTVYNILKDEVATDIPLNNSDPVSYVTFPCCYTEISNWLSEKSLVSTNDLFDEQTENGEPTTTDTDVSVSVQNDIPCISPSGHHDGTGDGEESLTRTVTRNTTLDDEDNPVDSNLFGTANLIDYTRVSGWTMWVKCPYTTSGGEWAYRFDNINETLDNMTGFLLEPKNLNGGTKIGFYRHYTYVHAYAYHVEGIMGCYSDLPNSKSESWTKTVSKKNGVIASPETTYSAEGYFDNFEDQVQSGVRAADATDTCADRWTTETITGADPLDNDNWSILYQAHYSDDIQYKFIGQFFLEKHNVENDEGETETKATAYASILSGADIALETDPHGIEKHVALTAAFQALVDMQLSESFSVQYYK